MTTVHLLALFCLLCMVTGLFWLVAAWVSDLIRYGSSEHRYPTEWEDEDEQSAD